MPRGVRVPSVVTALKVACQVGVAKNVLTPPPLAPPLAPSFHTTSPLIAVVVALRLVPPQASAKELEAGKSAGSAPSVTPSLEPLSPEAMHTVIPKDAAAWKASSMAAMACDVQVDSAPPQLMEMTDGLLVVS